MERTYTRTSRAAANVLLLVFLGVIYFNARGGGFSVALIALVVAAPAIVYYGYFIASQRCAKCRESVVVPYSSYDPVMGFFAVVTPFRVPLRCPHCDAQTPWGQSGSNNENAT
jgi:hypothetical protein